MLSYLKLFAPLLSSPLLSLLPPSHSPNFHYMPAMPLASYIISFLSLPPLSLYPAIPFTSPFTTREAKNEKKRGNREKRLVGGLLSYTARLPFFPMLTLSSTPSYFLRFFFLFLSFFLSLCCVCRCPLAGNGTDNASGRHKMMARVSALPNPPSFLFLWYACMYETNVLEGFALCNGVDRICSKVIIRTACCSYVPISLPWQSIR